MSESSRAPLSHRLLLRLYPRWFRSEFNADLLAHLAHQRGEARYRAATLGALRFWWEAGADALLTSVRLRFERVRERLLPAAVTQVERRRIATSFSTLAGDARLALRGLVRKPGYALVFIVTLGLGIGANTAIFSAVNGVLLRALPYQDGDRLVYLRHSAHRGGITNVLFSVPELNDYRAGTSSFEAVAEFSAMTFTMLGHDIPRRVRAGIVTGNYFEVMGLSPLLGRTIGPEDDGGNAPAVMVLSESYWRSVFGADRRVLGRTLRMNDRSVTIVGIVEPAPPYPERTDIYVNMATSPHHLDAAMSSDRSHRMTEVFARLAPSSSIEAARAEISAITSRLHTQYREAYDPGSGYDVAVTPLKRQLTTRARPTLLLLLATALLVLVIACANLANLALTRVLRRDHELAIRASLGASRSTLRRELLVENLLLALGGAALGVFIAFVGLDLLVRYTERFTARAAEITLDANVFLFALFAAFAASLLFTLLPPLPENDRVSATLRTGARSTSSAKAKRSQRALVVAQIGTSFVLLIGAGLLVRTMMHLQRIDPGFDTAPVLSMNIPDPMIPPSFNDASRTRYLGILDAVRAVPGVDAAALTTAIPFTNSTQVMWVPVAIEGHQPLPGAAQPRADFRVVSPGYFALTGIDVLRGREFVSTDLEDAQHVVVINESMARDYFGDESAIGRRIRWTDELMSRFMNVDNEWRTVVGVVADTRERGLEAEIVHTVYHPYPQLRLTGALMLRVSRDTATVMPAIRKAILARDPNQPIENVATLQQLSERALSARHLNTTLLGAFALLALIIAAVGIGGVLAFSVSSRTHEFGIRSALGAARHQIWAGVLVEGVTMVAIGLGLGAIAAVALTRAMDGLLVGVATLDPLTFLAVALLLASVAVAAAWAPAWRAARVSPIRALGAE